MFPLLKVTLFYRCSGVTIGDKAYGDNPVKFAVGDYCIHRQLVCDGVPNCIKGEDEEENGVSKCGSESESWLELDKLITSSRTRFS